MSDPYTPILFSLPGSVTPTLAIEVLPHGLTIHKVIVQVNGKTHDIVIGPEDPKDHSTIKYMNTIIGRYANRVPVGKHVVEKNGITTSFEALGNESPKVSLHGGPEGFDRRIWQKFTRLDDVKLFTKAEIQSIAARTDASAVIFSLTSPDGDQGYSGTLYLETLVVLVPPVKPDLSTVSRHELGSIVIVYRAKLVDLPEGQKEVTPINLTQHWGFNLDVSMQDWRRNTQGFESRFDYRGKLRLHCFSYSQVSNVAYQASHIAELQPNSLPTGRCIPVAEADNSSGAHIHDTKRIGDLFPGAGYDDYYLLSPRSDLKLVSPHRIPISEFSDSLISSKTY
ncbi:galactose mutarotase-like domain-containing protein [Boletus reticuloceps]|uniref:Galactose mutarotase-like domain-containing protein n=1 Tax=Boletus reticuloceps TaxID=495285 RepID=A0A8I2YF51_9AGAM|nr:galactose mutarotase-like domain-containing protein [Boletus reticuloceps]